MLTHFPPIYRFPDVSVIAKGIKVRRFDDMYSRTTILRLFVDIRNTMIKYYVNRAV